TPSYCALEARDRERVKELSRRVWVGARAGPGEPERCRSRIRLSGGRQRLWQNDVAQYYCWLGKARQRPGAGRWQTGYWTWPRTPRHVSGTVSFSLAGRVRECALRT